MTKRVAAATISRSAYEGLSALRARARSGDGTAQHLLAVVYALGLGVRPQQRKAAAWFRRAAAHGVPEAMVEAGLASFYGLGARRDLRLARRYFAQAWRHGSARGALWAAMSYDFEKPRDGRRALLWYGRAVAGGNVDAMVNLAVCLENEDAGPGGRRRALRWYRRAAAEGDALARKHLRRLKQGLPVSSMRSDPPHYAER